MNDDDQEMGPIDYVVIEFPPEAEPDGSALPMLKDLHDNGIIRVLDLAFIAAGEDGSVSGIEISQAGLGGEVDVTMFAEASSGLLDDEDLAEAGGVLEPGRVAAVLVYENTWAGPFAAALRRNGAQLVANGRIPVQSIIASAEQLENNG